MFLKLVALEICGSDDCRRLCKTIATTFDRILHYTCGLETSVPNLKGSESPQSRNEVMGPLESAALHITETSCQNVRLVTISTFLARILRWLHTLDSTFFFHGIAVM